MPAVGKELFSFDKEVAMDFILDIEFQALKTVVPALRGPWGGFLGFFAKIVLKWQIEYTVEGLHRLEVAVESFLKNRDYMKIRDEIKAKGVISEKEKARLFKVYVPIARNALTV